MRRMICAAALSLGMLGGSAYAADGAELFKKKCASCHGDEGKGDKKPCQKHECKDFTKADWQKESDDAALLKNISDGFPDKKMPAYKEKLSEDEIKSIVQFIRGLKK